MLPENLLMNGVYYTPTYTCLVSVRTETVQGQSLLALAAAIRCPTRRC